MVQDPPLPSPLSTLSHETRATLRDALTTYLTPPSDVAPLRVALRRVAEESRAQQVRAEQLMIAFKTLWEALPQVREVRDPVSRGKLLERLITVCIEEYYT